MLRKEPVHGFLPTTRTPPKKRAPQSGPPCFARQRGRHAPQVSRSVRIARSTSPTTSRPHLANYNGDPNAKGIEAAPAGLPVPRERHAGKKIFHSDVAGATCGRCHDPEGISTPIGTDLILDPWLWGDGSPKGLQCFGVAGGASSRVLH